MCIQYACQAKNIKGLCSLKQRFDIHKLYRQNQFTLEWQKIRDLFKLRHYRVDAPSAGWKGMVAAPWMSIHGHTTSDTRC
jgi:hypothetical protein